MSNVNVKQKFEFCHACLALTAALGTTEITQKHAPSVN